MEGCSSFKVTNMQGLKILSKDAKGFESDIRLIHRAAQFVAMVSNSFLPSQQDDSQNSFSWNAETNRLESRWIENPIARALLDIENFELIVDKYLSLEIIHLDGKSKDQVNEKLQEVLKAAMLDTTKLKPVTQFTIPPHAVDSGLPFTKPAVENLREWAAYLSNAQFLFDELRSEYVGASEVRVWPHHFDMGFYFSVSKDESGQDVQTVGAGLAIPDGYVDEPYFYINHWSKNPIRYPAYLPDMGGGYWNRKDWNGLVLPSSTILAQGNQYRFVKNFFKEGIEKSIHLLSQNASFTIS